MMNAYAGRDKFREGVRRYMRAHAFGNTVDTDLWRLVEQTAGQPIVAIERDFTRQDGLPLVRASGTAQGVRLVQTRFADDPASIAGLTPQHWRLPLAIAAVRAEPHYVLLQGTAMVDQPPPLLVNAGQAGYARVLYGDELLSRLTAQMNSLNSADQMGLINDARALGIAGYTSAANLLDVAAALPREANPIVWQRLLEIVREIDRHYADTPARAAFRRFALAMLAPLSGEIGPPGTPGGDAKVQILRSDLTETRGSLGDARVIEDARKRFAGGDGTAAEQRSALAIVAEQADTSGFDALLAKADHTPDPLEKLHIFRALADVNDPDLARRMMDIALGNQVPAGSAAALIAVLARKHADMVWQMLAPRLDDPSLPFEKTLRWSIAGSIAGYSADPARIADLEAYEAASVPPEARKPFLSAVASIRRNQRFTGTVLPQIDQWIARRAPAAGQ
jgi:aminopeptidase N